jgi:peptidyl-prolyl cis-trans isomerase D
MVAMGTPAPYIPAAAARLVGSSKTRRTGFMLRGIHKASANWLGRVVMGVVLGLIAISFGIWGIGDIFRGFGQSTVAKVGSNEIRVEQFRQTYQDRLQSLGRSLGRPILPDQARAIGLDRQVLGQMVAEAVIDERVADMRLGVSDAEIARQITDHPNFKGITGQFDRSRFEAVLRNIGYTEARFLAEQRRTMLRQQLIGTVSSVPNPPKAVLEAFNRFQNEERTIEYVTLGAAQAGDLPAPTDEVLANFFEERKVVFRAPEYRKVTLVVMTPDDVASMIEVSDADLKKAYQDRRTRYETPERRHIKQIVFPNMEEARAGAAKLGQGTSFEALAAERGLQETDIDLGTVAKSAVVDRAVADAAFAMKADEVSAPVEGRFGIAVVKVVTIEPPTTKAFEEVSADLKRELAAERAKNEIVNVHEKIEDERLGGATLADAARKFKLKPRLIEAIDRNGKGPDGAAIADLPQGTDVLPAVFAAEIHGDNEPLRLTGGGYVWYDVAEIKPSRDRPLAEIKDEVLARWRDDQIAWRLKAKATEMIDKLKAEWRPGIKRNSTLPGLPPGALTQVFRTSLNATNAADGSTPAERIVFHVTEIKVPTFDPASTDAKQLDDALRSRMTEDLAAQYIAKLESDIGVTINQNALNQVTGGGGPN